MKNSIWIVASLLAFCLTGCDMVPAGTGDTPMTEPTMCETVPQTEATEPTEPEPPSVPGYSVIAEGESLSSGSLIIEETLYVKASELFGTLPGAGLSGDEEQGYLLDWNGCVYHFIPRRDTVAAHQESIPLSAPVRRYQQSVWIPLEEVCAILGISILEDPEMSILYCAGSFPDQIPSGIRIPVLMYHAVDSNIWGHEELFVNPEVMESHLRFLTENGYDPILFEDLPRVEEYDKPVILTFDDGYLDNYNSLYPLLQKYQAKATIFVVTSSMGNRPTSMTPEMVRELSESGLVSIQSHTVNHKVLRDLTAEEQAAEMELSRLYVARMTGREPFVISYPTGAYNQDTLRLSMEYYRFAVTMNEGDYVTGSDPSLVSRYYVRRSTTLEELARMVADAGQHTVSPDDPA